MCLSQQGKTQIKLKAMILSTITKLSKKHRLSQMESLMVSITVGKNYFLLDKEVII